MEQKEKQKKTKNPLGPTGPSLAPTANSPNWTQGPAPLPEGQVARLERLELVARLGRRVVRIGRVGANAETGCGHGFPARYLQAVECLAQATVIWTGCAPFQNRPCHARQPLPR